MSGPAKMRVLVMPDYRPGNPYQRLLAEALGELGVELEFPAGYRRVLPLWRAWRGSPEASVLHLHWLEPYLRGRNAFMQAVYGVKFLFDVAMLGWSGVGMVWTVHNRVSHESRWPRIERWVQRGLARQAGRVIVHARSHLPELQRDLRLQMEKVSVIPHGHYRAAYGAAVERPEARAALGLDAAGRMYLCFGMLRPYKGIERLIAEWLAMEHAAGEMLVIAGKPLDRAYLARLEAMAKGAASIRILAEFVPDSEVHLYFSAADVVVLPFNSILTSGSLLLGMSFGKPVIAPRLGAIAEMVGGADDLLYDAEDACGLRASLERSSAMDLDALREKTERRCDGLEWGRLAALTLDAYEQASAKRSKGVVKTCVDAER